MEADFTGYEKPSKLMIGKRAVVTTTYGTDVLYSGEITAFTEDFDFVEIQVGWFDRRWFPFTKVRLVAKNAS